MNEWFKNICLTPLKYGADKVNSLVVNSIALILESYGNKLFNIKEYEKIIDKIESHDNKNKFIFNKLQLKDFSMNVDCNTIKIDQGTIDGMTICFPWKTLLIETSNINIDSIDIVVSMTKLNNDSVNNISIASTFLETSGTNNINLQNAYIEIKSLLIKYLNKICLAIKKINIVFNEKLNISMSDLVYDDNIIKIGNIFIHSNNVQVMFAKFDGILYDINAESLIIDMIDIKSSIVEFLPLVYLDFSSKSKFNITMLCKNLKIDDLMFNNLLLTIDQDKLLIKNVSSIYIENVFILRPKINNEILVSISFDDFNCFFLQSFYLYVINFNSVQVWAMKIKETIVSLCNKFIQINVCLGDLNQQNTKDNYKIQLHDFNASVIFGDIIANIQIINILFNRAIELCNLVCECYDAILKVNNIKINGDGLFDFQGIKLISKEFNIVSDKISILQNDKSCCQSTLFVKEQNKQININLYNADVDNLTKVINYITKIYNSITISTEKNSEIDLNNSTLDLSSSLDALSNDTKIILNILKSKLITQHNNNNILLLVKKMTICLNDYSANDIDAEIFINNFFLAKILIKHYSVNKIVANFIKINLTPETIDTLNGLLTLLLSETNNSSQKIEPTKDSNNDNLISNDKKNIDYIIIDQYEPDNYPNQKNNKKNIDTSVIILSKSISKLDDFKHHIINNYKEKQDSFDFKIKIKSLDIALCDMSTCHQDKPFLHAIIKNVVFSKIMDRIQKKNIGNNIRFIQHPSLYRPTHKDNYQLAIDTGAILDVECLDPEWKYFVKFSQYGMFKLHVTKHGNIINISAHLSPIITNIREETLIRLYKFITKISNNINNTDNQILIESFNINSIPVVFNYFPSALKNMNTGSKIFTIKNHKIILSPLRLSYADSISKLFEMIGEKWGKDADFDNIIKFVPNIKIIEPYTKYILHAIKSTIKFFKNLGNK